MDDNNFDPSRRKALKAGFGTALRGILPSPVGGFSNTASSALGEGATVSPAPAVAEMMARNIADALGYGAKLSVTHTDRGHFKEVGGRFWKLTTSGIQLDAFGSREEKIYTAELENPLEIIKLIRSMDCSATDSHYLHEALIDSIQAHYQRVLYAQIKMMLLPDAHFNKASDYLKAHAATKDLTEVQGLSGSVVDRKEMPKKIASTFFHMLEIIDHVNENLHFRNSALKYDVKQLPALLEGTAILLNSSVFFSSPAPDVSEEDWEEVMKSLTFEDRAGIFFEELYAQHPDNGTGKRLGWFQLPALMSQLLKKQENAKSDNPELPEIEGEKREELRRLTLQTVRSVMEVYASKKPDKAASIKSFLRNTEYDYPHLEHIVHPKSGRQSEAGQAIEPHIRPAFQTQQFANAASAIARALNPESPPLYKAANLENEPPALEYQPGDPLDFDISLEHEPVPTEPKSPDWN